MSDKNHSHSHGSHSKGKATAAANAQNRAQHERHLAEAPHVSRNEHAVGQQRAVDETALSGVDRPSGRPLDKHTGREAPVDLGRTPLSAAQQSIRSNQDVPDGDEQHQP